MSKIPVVKHPVVLWQEVLYSSSYQELENKTLEKIVFLPLSECYCYVESKNWYLKHAFILYLFPDTETSYYIRLVP